MEAVLGEKHPNTRRYIRGLEILFRKKGKRAEVDAIYRLVL